MKIIEMSATALGEEIKKGQIGVKEAVKAYLDQIEAVEPSVHAYLDIDEKKIYARVKEVEKGIRQGKYTGPLAGVPIAVKDNICTRGQATTCASKILNDFVPPYSAGAVEKLEEAGMILLGKTNMDEFAMGSTTETSAFGETKNPWDLTRVPGGSSGGSCAAVAAGEAPLALGSDTGGSIRQPSAFCGVTGLKPTYGTVSRYGLVAYASSLDQIGPIGKNTKDCGALLDVIAGYDKRDSTSIQRKLYDFSKDLGEDIRGLRVGVPKEYLSEGLDSEIKKAIVDVVNALSQNGAIVEFFSLGMTDYVIPAYYIIACAGKEAKKRILLGSFVLSSGYYDAYYLKALKTKALIKKAFDEAFVKYDVLLAPASPSPAPHLGESLTDSLKMYLSDIYTVAVNLAGLPAISMPWTLDSQKLPVGLQFIGNCFEEKKVLQAAMGLEKIRGDFPLAFAKEEG